MIDFSSTYVIIFVNNNVQITLICFGENQI